MTEADLPTHYSSSNIMKNYTKKNVVEKMEGINSKLKSLNENDYESKTIKAENFF